MFQWNGELSFSCLSVICCFCVTGKVIKIWSFRLLFFYLLQVLASKPFRILAVYIHALNLCPMLEFHLFWIVTGSGTRWCDFWAWEASCKSAALFWAVLYLEGNCERNGETGFATDFSIGSYVFVYNFDFVLKEQAGHIFYCWFISL